MIAFSRQLPEDTYGQYQGFWTSYYIITAFASAGIPAFILTYPHGYIKSMLARLQKKYITVYVLWVAALSIVFVLLQQTAGAAGWVLFIFMFSSIGSALLESYFTVARRFATLITVNTIYAILFLWLHWQVLQEGWTLAGLFTGITILSCIKLAVYCILVAWDKKVSEDATLAYAGVRNLWLHMWVYDLTQMLIRWLDKFIIAIVLSSHLSAIYFNGSIDIPFLPIILGAVSSAALMQMAMRNTGDADVHALQITLQSSRLLSSLAFPLLFFFLLFANELFVVVFSAKYAASVPIFMVSVCALPIRAYSFTTVLQNRHKGAVINIGNIISIAVSCMLIYPLYMLWGLPGVALSFVLSKYVHGVYYLHHISKLLHVPIWRLLPFKNWLLKIIVFATAYMGIHYVLSLYTNMQNALICGCLFTGIVVAATIAIELKQAKTHAAKQDQV